MGFEKKEALAVGNENPVRKAADEFKTSFIKCKCWLSKQSLPLKCVIRDVATSAEATYYGALLCLVGESLLKDVCSIILKIPPPSTQFLICCGEYRPLVRSFIEGGTRERGFNYAVMLGVNKGISCVLRNIKGKEDVGTSMVAGFGYGVALSLVTGMRGPKVMSVGVIFALFNGGLFKAGKLLTQGQAEDVSHDKTKGGFSSLSIGLDHAMNFNKDLKIVFLAVDADDEVYTLHIYVACSTCTSLEDHVVFNDDPLLLLFREEEERNVTVMAVDLEEMVLDLDMIYFVVMWLFDSIVLVWVLDLLDLVIRVLYVLWYKKKNPRSYNLYNNASSSSVKPNQSTGNSLPFTFDQIQRLMSFIGSKPDSRELHPYATCATQHMTFSTEHLYYVIDVSHLKLTMSHPNGIVKMVKHVGNFEDSLQKLGHPFDQVLSSLKNKIQINSMYDTQPCDVCLKAKQTREPFSFSDPKTKCLAVNKFDEPYDAKRDNSNDDSDDIGMSPDCADVSTDTSPTPTSHPKDAVTESLNIYSNNNPNGLGSSGANPKGDDAISYDDEYNYEGEDYVEFNQLFKPDHSSIPVTFRIFQGHYLKPYFNSIFTFE
ncbi:chloroplastic import inner membrane translocase subunit HP30-2 [Tanacetum coccineum]